MVDGWSVVLSLFCNPIHGIRILRNDWKNYYCIGILFRKIIFIRFRKRRDKPCSHIIIKYLNGPIMRRIMILKFHMLPIRSDFGMREKWSKIETDESLRFETELMARILMCFLSVVVVRMSCAKVESFWMEMSFVVYM